MSPAQFLDSITPSRTATTFLASFVAAAYWAGNVSTKQTSLATDLRDVKTQLKEEICRVDARVGRVEERVGRLDVRVGRLEERVESLQEEMHQVLLLVTSMQSSWAAERRDDSRKRW